MTDCNGYTRQCIVSDAGIVSISISHFLREAMLHPFEDCVAVEACVLLRPSGRNRAVLPVSGSHPSFDGVVSLQFSSAAYVFETDRFHPSRCIRSGAQFVETDGRFSLVSNCRVENMKSIDSVVGIGYSGLGSRYHY